VYTSSRHISREACAWTQVHTDAPPHVSSSHPLQAQQYTRAPVSSQEKLVRGHRCTPMHHCTFQVRSRCKHSSIHEHPSLLKRSMCVETRVHRCNTERLKCALASITALC